MAILREVAETCRRYRVRIMYFHTLTCLCCYNIISNCAMHGHGSLKTRSSTPSKIFTFVSWRMNRQNANTSRYVSSVKLRSPYTGVESVWGSGAIAPHILNLATRYQWSVSRPGQFTARETAPVPTEEAAGRRPQPDMDGLQKKSLLLLPGNKP